ncbi:acyltransferase [Limosilactobacillus reuteri]|uniref:acyltransferase family protein n=1 Tax=Limosilactobacillus reuteri TaxID=1598 RepID=UPI00098FE882|nr:acyltransferase [Limosilactobacillus reuteri]MCC4490571.1 acyltransferase [Limosilactobacillus reuteri]MEE1989009.1 acyltransferase [Limosilactobacillus reuteri]WOZ75027.1 acyltransferase [Limosilactobacillus reuteri]
MSSVKKIRKRYTNIDGLRSFSCLGIIAMHILANSEYIDATGWIKEVFIPSLTLLVYLFMMISGFGMFCGYYTRFKEGSIELNYFFKRRYTKILPFFSFLIFLDIIITRSSTHVIQGLTELTMVFGLLPNNQLDVVGVAWFLGVVFLFYMLFPFFVFLCWNKKRAWLSLIISILVNIACANYFYTMEFVKANFADRHTLLYCAPYFFVGGLIYLYRQEIDKFVHKSKFILIIPILITSLFYLTLSFFKNTNFNDLETIILFGTWLAYAIGIEQDNSILTNRITRYLSSISLEMYLAQMFIFDAIKRMGFLYVLGRGYLSYILILIMTVIGLIVFVEVCKISFRLLQKGLSTISMGDRE